MTDNQTVDLRDYLAVLVRRRVAFGVTAGVIFALSMAVTFLWPSTYSATATVLIEEQDVPADLVRSAVASTAVQRIQTISQQVMTRANLLRIVEKFDMYADARAEGRTEKLLTSMRERIKIETVDVNGIDPASGRLGQIAIAFTVSFEHRDPEITQKVTQELASLFLEQNEKSRTARATDALRFLTAEAEILSDQIAELESGLATFKEQNHASLPGLTELNLRLIDHLERQQASVDTQIRSLEERKYGLEGDLAQVSPWNPMVSSAGERVVDPITMLRTLRAQHVSASARYSARHPDVIRLRREIEALEKQVGSVDATLEVAKDLARRRGALLVARDKYAEDHPDVVQLRREIALLGNLPSQAPAEMNEQPAVADIAADNPAYITLRARLKAVDSELASLRAFRAQLEAKLGEYGQRIAQAPQIERGYLTLSREYESAVRRYRKIKESQVDARLRRDLEAAHAEKFSLIDPAQVPEEPIKPNRALAALLGLLFSLTGGVGGAAFAEARGKRQPYSHRVRLVDAERTIAELRREVAVLKGDAEELNPSDRRGRASTRSGQRHQ